MNEIEKEIDNLGRVVIPIGFRIIKNDVTNQGSIVFFLSIYSSS